MQIIEQATLWEIIKSDFQGLFPHDVYRTWFENLELLSEEDDSYMIGVPNDFAAIWIQDNYHDIIVKRLQLATGRSANVSYKVVQSSSESEVKPVESVSSNNRLGPLAATKPRPSKEKPSNPPNDIFLINPKNTFANFVIGSGNQLAHAACVAVANAPARAYNPLFLYGDSGLGKTHLMHAIAHESIKHRQNLKVAYVSTEKFTNEFIRAIQENAVTKFRQRYRNVDILSVDDIHFLSGKERIQEEFFHTFNDLFESQKQIVLCSDRPAGEIAKLESRLLSRFQWGLVADIQPPDLETRVAILQKKADAMDLKLPYEIIEFLAERVSKNVRRMEGALTRVAGYAALVKGVLDVASVERLLKDILQEEAHTRITIDKIQKIVIEHYHLRPSDMQSKRRPANIAFPRQIAMYLCRTLTHDSLSDIGETFGGRDHGTVIHACKAVENMMDQDESIKRSIEYLKSQLAGGRS